MTIAKWLCFALGVLIVIGNWLSIIRTLIVPGSYNSAGIGFIRTIWRKLFHFIARKFGKNQTKHRLLSLQEPIFLILLLGMWLIIFLFGFALILLPLTHGTLSSSIKYSASGEFTLGNAIPKQTVAIYVVYFAAVTGLIVVALLIGFLPTLYSSYSRRERLVSILESRAGLPAFGPIILIRHVSVGLLEDLPKFYSTWEDWAADITETHTTYRSLLFFRSPKSDASWLTSLLAVLDSGAIYLALCPNRAPVQTRLFVRMGFSALREIARSVKIEFDEDPIPNSPISVTFDEFKTEVDKLIMVNFPIERPIDEAYEHFKGWRINYESIAYKLANYIAAPASPWSGTRNHLQNNFSNQATSVKIVKNRTPDDPEGSEFGFYQL
jgi:hypothetical protein